MMSLSLKSGLAADAFRNILTGRSQSPRSNTIDAIAKTLKVSPGILLGHEPLPNEFMDGPKAVLPPVVEKPPSRRASAPMKAWHRQQNDAERPPDVVLDAAVDLRRAVIGAVRAAMVVGLPPGEAVEVARRAAILAGIAGGLDPEVWADEV